MKALLYGIVFMFISSVTAYPMTYEQMMNLKGANMLGVRADVLLKQYGLPTYIVDQGVTTDMPRKKVKWGRHKFKLTDDNWNFVYITKKLKKEDIDARYWINTNPIFPVEFGDLVHIVFITAGKRIDLIYDKEQKKYITKAPKTLFESHEVTYITGSFASSIPVGEITTLYGEDYKKVRDTTQKEVIRYSIVKKGYSDYPEFVYQVDFHTNGYSVNGYNMSFDYAKWYELVDKWLIEQREKVRTELGLDKAQPAAKPAKE